MVFLSFKIVQFVLVSFSILKTLSYLYFCITFHKEGHQNQAQVQPRRAGTCPCKHSGVRPNNHSHTHAVAHAFTSPHILMSQRQCRICRGHTVSYICPSLLSSVRWATRAPPAHQASERTLSLHPSQAPALLTGDAFTSGRKGGRAVEGTSFQICPSHPQHSQYHTPAPPKTPATRPTTPHLELDHARTLPLPRTAPRTTTSAGKRQNPQSIWDFLGDLLIAQRRLALIRRCENWNFTVLLGFES